MVRLSEILKKEEISRVSFSEQRSDAVKNAPSKAHSFSIQGIYEESLAFTRLILSKALNGEKIDLSQIIARVNILIEHVLLDDAQLNRWVDYYDAQEDYLVVHSLNVCILSLDIGKSLRYNHADLLELGIGALLHDIGMLKVKSILDKNRRLYNAEYEEVKNHVNYGAEFLEHLEGVSSDAISIVRHHHERIDASGYPQGLAAGDIPERAQIVGLADVYEALVHSRPHRDKMAAFESEVIREMISERKMFSPYIFRVFLERLTQQPAYMLWLATDGIYQALEESKRLSSEIELLKMSQKNGQKTTKRLKKRGFPYPALAAFALLVLLIVVLNTQNNRKLFLPQGESLYFAQNKAPLKINYDFSSNISDIYSTGLDLVDMNLSRYNSLIFSAKIEPVTQGNSRNIRAALKIEIENDRNEKGQYYIQGIAAKWGQFRVPLSEFSTISDWSRIKRISFYLEPWNIGFKKGAFLVDEVRFFRKR